VRTPKLEEYNAVDFFELTESVFSVEEVDGKQKMTANVRLIKAGKSKNGRNYRPSALKESVDRKIWDGVRMFENHSKVPPLQRPMREMVAGIESTTYHEEDKAVDAKVVFFDKPFFEKAQNAMGFMGDSINALVAGQKIREGNTITEDIHRIVQPRSVDFVIYPAAGGEILAFEGEGDMINWTDITAADVKQNAASVYEALKAEILAEQKPTDDVKPVVGLTQEQVDSQIAAALKARDDEAAETQKKIGEVNAKVAEAFKTSGLPEPVRKRLVAAYEGQTEFDEEGVKTAISEAKEELKAIGVGPKITDQGPSGAAGGEADTKKTFTAQESVAAAFGMTKEAKKEDGK